MNIRSRITLSTVLGIALAGLCLGSAQAQSGTNRQTRMHHDAMRDHDMDDDMMEDYEIPEPAPVGYPFAAPGGLHLYHYTDYTHERIEPDSSYSKHLDNEYRRDRRIRERMRDHDVHWRDSAMIREDRMPYGGYYMTDENGMMMSEEARTEPAPLGYPFAGPGALHLYHFTDYSREGIAEGSASMKSTENMEKEDESRHDRMRWYGGRTVDENDMTYYEEMRQPAPLGYPFAAPGGLHLYHWTDYTQEGMEEGSSTTKQMDNSERMERRRERRMKQNQTPK